MRDCVTGKAVIIPKRKNIYNPRSVVLALENNNLENYRTSSGPYDELFYYIGANEDKFAEMASVITLVYLQARDGLCDFIFYPYRKDDDAAIIELRVNHSAKEAIQQIKDRQYALRFEGKIGEKPEYTGRILAVGIVYHKDDGKKSHKCRSEFLHGRLC